MTKALDSRSSENGKEQRSRSFYPDKLSLIDTDPDSLIKYSKRVVSKFVIERLRRFAQINPRQFRKLWLLFQYQDYRVEIDFFTARSIIKSYVEKKALGSRNPEYITSPNRRQVLGAIREHKIRSFKDFYLQLYMESNTFNIFEFAATADIELLLAPPKEIDFWSTEYTEDSEPTHLDFVGSIHGRTYKLPKVIWDLLLNKDATDEELIELLIDLPRVEGDGSHLPSVDLGNEISYYANTIINDDDLDNLFALFEG